VYSNYPEALEVLFHQPPQPFILIEY
jgi:hypothetical protein